MNTLNELPERLNKAITKLYNAFHNNELDAMSCESCAVGNLLGHGKWTSNYCEGEGFIGGKITPCLFQVQIKNESLYSLEELGEVERRFLKVSMKKGKYIQWNKFKKKKQIQFEGLCSVIEYLCELDNIPNIMEIQSLFEFDENNKAVKELLNQ